MGSHRVTYTDRRGRQLDIVVYEDASAYLELRPSDEEMATSVTIPADKREGLARALAGWHSSVVPADRGHATFRVDARCPTCDQAAQPDAADMQEDLHSILRALNLPTAARASSPHEVVEREVVPEIWRLRGQVGRLKVQAAGEYGPADIAHAEDAALRQAADELEAADPVDNKDVAAWLREVRGTGEPPLKQPDRPEPVAPSSLKVGDVVEIEADDGSWMVRGRVNTTAGSDRQKPISIGVPFNFGALWPNVSDATVRILHRPEPEPDEAAVEALREAIKDCRDDELGDHFDEPRLALALAKRNVRVVSTDA